ncbi:glycosyltransferase [Nocardioides mesophilus]|uniref:Glycosyltransferase n=2 Tax=Nocardioides mesophilus TaxID=433659 RepID=A0A7G9RHP5_9ACTN|nr:glycosyltransferase [Nocardioides mesophilus]
MSLVLLLGTELEYDVEQGIETWGLSAPGPYVPRVEELGVGFVALPALTRAWSIGDDLRAARQLHAALRRLRPDVLHTHNPKTGVLGRVVGRAAGVPVVVNTCHGLWARREDPLVKRLLVYGAEAAAAVVSDAELYQNGEDRRTLRRLVRAGKASVVGNGTDLRRFVRDRELGLRLRREWGIAPDELVVGGVGRLVAEKGIAEFVEVARRLRGRATFVWVGPADLDKRDAVSAAEEAVRFVGERSDMAAVYNALDVFVLPSYREGFSRSGMEAAACETAMVLSDIRGCREIGQDGVEVLLVPPRDAAALGTAVQRLLDEPLLRHRLARAAGARAREEFDQRRVARASVTTYAQVAARKGLGWGRGGVR